MRSRKVLVADDSLLVHRMYDLLLRGHEIIHAADGVEALERIAAHGDVELVFLDINMPRLDGISVLGRLKAAPETRRLPIVMVSTQGRDEDTARAYAAGCDGYVTKPFRQDTVAALLRALVGA
jgi:CheY-like chemotaxis protein